MQVVRLWKCPHFLSLTGQDLWRIRICFRVTKISLSCNESNLKRNRGLLRGPRFLLSSTPSTLYLLLSFEAIPYLSEELHLFRGLSRLLGDRFFLLLERIHALDG